MTNEQPEEITKPKRKSYFFYFKAVSIVFLLIFAYVWFLVPPRQIDGPIRLEKDKDGNLTLVGQDDSKNPASIHAGKLKANNSRISSTTSNKSNTAYFFSNSLVLLNFSKHPLMERLGIDVLDILKKESNYDRVEYYPLGHFPELGKQAPDQYLTLKLESIEESGLLATNLKATIVARFGNMLVRSNSSTQDHLTPPVMRFYTNIKLEHESTMEGIESSAAKYKMQSQNIAKEITTDIFKQIEKYEKDEDLIAGRQLDPMFYPDYTPTPEFKFLKSFNPKLLTSTHGIMSHNETYWKLENIDDLQKFVSTVFKELEQDGWKSGRSFKLSDWDDSDPENVNRMVRNLRMTKGSQIFKFFHARMNSQSKDDGVYYVRFQDRITTDELKGIFEKLLAKKNPDYEFLIFMRRYAHHTQRSKIIESIKTNPPQSREAWLALAEHYSSKKKKEETFDALQKLYHINFASTDSNRDDSTIKRIAKKQKLDFKKIKKIDFELLKKLGFAELTTESEPKEVTFKVGSSAKFILTKPDKNWKIMAIEIHPEKITDGKRTYSMKVIQSEETRSRWWSRSTGHRFQSPKSESETFHGRVVRFEIEKLDDETFKVTGKFDPAPKKKPKTKKEKKTAVEV